MKNEKAVEFYAQLENREVLEHRDVLLAIGVILKTKEGLDLFTYLFKNLDVACLPEQNLEGNMLHDNLGFLRAGNSIYKLVCEADSTIAASILSKLERKKYDRLLELHNFEQSNN